MRGANANNDEALPAATLDGACARLPFCPNACPKACAARTRSILTPHAAVQEMSDLLDADLGRPALEVLTRLCDQGVRLAVLYKYMRRARLDRRALRR